MRQTGCSWLLNNNSAIASNIMEYRQLAVCVIAQNKHTHKVKVTRIHRCISRTVIRHDQIQDEPGITRTNVTYGGEASKTVQLHLHGGSGWHWASDTTDRDCIEATLEPHSRWPRSPAKETHNLRQLCNKVNTRLFSTNRPCVMSVTEGLRRVSGSV